MKKEMNDVLVCSNRARRILDELDSMVLVLPDLQHQAMAGKWMEDCNVSSFDLLFHEQ